MSNDDNSSEEKPRYEYQMTEAEAELKSKGLKFRSVGEYEKRTRRGGYVMNTPARSTGLSLGLAEFADRITKIVEQPKPEEPPPPCAVCSKRPCVKENGVHSELVPTVVVLKKPSLIQRVIDWLFARA